MVNKSCQDRVSVSSFEDLLKLTGRNGWRNYLIFYACSIGTMIMAMHTFAYQFVGATPAHWCSIEELSASNWTDDQIKDIAIPYTVKNGQRVYSSCVMRDLDYEQVATKSYEEIKLQSQKNVSFLTETTVPCYNRRFEEHLETVVTKWDLVCDRRALYSTTQAAIQAGMLIGAVTFGYLIDRFGRFFMYRICVVTYLAGGFLTAISPTIGVFILLKVITAMLGNGVYMAGFVLSMEYCDVSQRSYISTYYVIPWAVGIMLTPAIAYLVQTWYWLEVALTAPGLILLFNFWILLESPRWLIMKGRLEEAHDTLSCLAQCNGRTLPRKPDLLVLMEIIQKSNKTETKNNIKGCNEKIKEVIKDLTFLFVDKEYRIMTLGVFFCLFSVSMVYYGVSLGSVTLSTNDYLYIFLGGLIEIPSYVLLWPAVVVLGRKKTYILLYFLSAISIFLVMLLTLYFGDSFPILKLVLYLAGKFAITAAFHLAWVFTAELYPTRYRSLILGEGTGVGRVGSICSPYINDLLGMITSWAPAALFGGFSVSAGLVAVIFPETTGKILPDVCLHHEKCDKEKTSVKGDTELNLSFVPDEDRVDSAYLQH